MQRAVDRIDHDAHARVAAVEERDAARVLLGLEAHVAEAPSASGISSVSCDAVSAIVRAAFTAVGSPGFGTFGTRPSRARGDRRRLGHGRRRATRTKACGQQGPASAGARTRHRAPGDQRARRVPCSHDRRSFDESRSADRGRHLRLLEHAAASIATFECPRERRAAALVETAAARRRRARSERRRDAVRAAFDAPPRAVESTASAAARARSRAGRSRRSASRDAAARAPELARRFEDAALAGERRSAARRGRRARTLRSRGVRVALICDTGMSPRPRGARAARAASDLLDSSRCRSSRTRSAFRSRTRACSSARSRRSASRRRMRCTSATCAARTSTAAARSAWAPCASAGPTTTPRRCPDADAVVGRTRRSAGRSLETLR